MTTKNNEMKIVGILAYGSLISNPGCEINMHRIGTIYNVTTPFPVEFARKSNKRNSAPTLVPFKDGGQVKGQIFVMNLCLEEAANVLYRREINKVCKLKHTYDKDKRGISEINSKKIKWKSEKDSNVYVKKLASACEWPELASACEWPEYVLVTWIDDNMKFDGIKKNRNRYADILACRAIISVPEAERCRDGINYLNDAQGNGIDTVLSDAYKRQVLELTGSKCLYQAFVRVFHKRRELQEQKDNINNYLSMAEIETDNSNSLDELKTMLKGIFENTN